eukprot:TRINITY_DN5521_c0_g1_i1.p1 TRINITY_DN5521_c0_g1~~TRINITY_DN5521_c0_g1_i1.p1  ORF type:complete len:781 (+),score=153.96 TRINITY_DN5521_c0_g1_i1:50-2392(+)
MSGTVTTTAAIGGQSTFRPAADGSLPNELQADEILLKHLADFQKVLMQAADKRIGGMQEILDGKDRELETNSTIRMDLAFALGQAQKEIKRLMKVREESVALVSKLENERTAVEIRARTGEDLIRRLQQEKKELSSQLEKTNLKQIELGEEKTRVQIMADALQGELSVWLSKERQIVMENEKMRKKTEELNSELQEARRKLDDFEREKQLLKGEIEKQRLGRDIANQDISFLEKESSRLRQDRDGILKQWKDAIESMCDRDLVLNRLQNERKAAISILKTAQERDIQLQRENELLESALEHSRKTIDALKTEWDKTGAYIGELNSAKDAIEEDLKGARIEASYLKTRNDSLENENKRMNEDVIRYRERVSQLEREKKSLEKDIDNMKLESQHSERILENRIHEVEQDREGALKDGEYLARRIFQDNTKLINANAKLEVKNNDLVTDNEQLRKIITSLESEMSQLRSEAKAFADKVIVLEYRLLKTENESKLYARHPDDVAKIACMDREIYNLTKELNEQKSKYSQIEKLWIQGTREAMSDQRQFQQYEATVSDLKDRIGVADIAKQKMQDEVDSVKKNMSEVQVLYNLALLEVKKTKDDIEEQKKENLRLKVALEDYKAQFECKAAELKHDTEGFKTELHIAQSTISDLKKARESLIRELSQTQAKMTLQKDMITARSADQNETDKRIAELNVQVAHLTRQLQEASRVNSTLSRHIEKNLAGYAQNSKTRLSKSQEDQNPPQLHGPQQTQDKLPPLDRISKSTTNLPEIGTSLTPRPPQS